MQKPDELPVAAWGTYFATGDVDASAARAQELGAILTVPATSMENVGRYAVLTDPTGAAFGLYARES
jgi:predicted enzyme related to lactoylglutathione lyase